MRCLLAIFSILCLCGAKDSPELHVRLSHGGGVSGHYRTSNSGRGILAYTNIPYAEPPVGEMRFRDPVSKRPWTGNLPANQEDIQCPQIVAWGSRKSVEDCLYLNVYVPQDAAKKTLPAIVYIHGGGFVMGSGSLHELDPELILEHNVILITGNYRLGPLGFLASFEGDLTGNWGMKDQQMLLKWVRENIASFGGDPDHVTLIGQSAGSASVGLHLMAPASKGLFQRAIMFSGTPYDLWAPVKGYAKEQARKVIQTWGCDGKEDNGELMECLRGVSLEEISKTRDKFYDWNSEPSVPFGPVLESLDSPSPFLQEVDADKINPDVQLIIGEAHDEGAFKAAAMTEEMILDLEANFTRIIPSVLSYAHLEEEKREKWTEKIQKFYLKGSGGEFEWNRDKHKFTEMISDGLFLSGFDKFLKRRLRTGGQTFVYLFNYRGSNSITDIISDAAEDFNWGVSHGDDLMHFFPVIKMAAPHRVMAERDLQFGAKLVTSFVGFAVSGDPTGSEGFEKWRPATKDNFEYLRIGNCNREKCPEGEEGETAIESELFTERLNFWKQLREEEYWGQKKTIRTSAETKKGEL